MKEEVTMSRAELAAKHTEKVLTKFMMRQDNENSVDLELLKK